MGKPNIIKDKSYKFSLSIIAMCSALRKNNEFEISKQLFKAGTSIGANVEEEIAGQSKRDFAAKMSIALKEAREADYWLRLLRDSGLRSDGKIEMLLDESGQIRSILGKIVKTTKENL